jgi:hypothetical protein
MATINFVSSETKINTVTKTVTLSKLFLWYKSDFIYDKIDLVEENKNSIDSMLLEYLIQSYLNFNLIH